ncbi:MAG TPA: hypothetical protein ENJ08_04295 [Gammaproteobacteria bacterium]|nr:hypothetical protein [Gammaproteobacteria bacterium]
MKYSKPLLTGCLFLLISACGGSGGGNTAINAAEINSNNAQQLSVIATTATRAVILVNSTESGLTQKNSLPAFDSIAFSEKLAQQLKNTSNSGDFCSGGDYTTTIAPETGDATITFNNCVTSFGTIASGTVITLFTDTGIDLAYISFSINLINVTNIIDFSVSCTENSTGITCSPTSSITGITFTDGSDNSISNISISSNPDLTFNVSFDIAAHDNGQFSVKAKSVIFNCPAPDLGNTSSGSITLSSSGKSALVTFDSCSSYTVTVDGVARSFTWN